MTEAEWVRAKDPTLMLEFLRGKVSDRKLRLFAVACCWEGKEYVRDWRRHEAIRIAELYADGLATPTELHVAFIYGAEAPPPDNELSPAEHAADAVSCESAYLAAEEVLGHHSRYDYDAPYRIILWWRQKKRMRVFQVRVFQDLFGNPFRPVTAAPAWQTSTAVALARQMYDSRDFGALPILADALQDAGCDHPDILAHCREPGPHFRGCWVVDLVLGKE
ncbi:MAG: hypothetical protein JWO38_4097 [Gemmataceae bacterium]|nr:hypothetical protein [Gemmataceae bacterium]